jgi:hypothetical protein
MSKRLYAVALIVACGGYPVESLHTQAVTLQALRQRATAYVVTYQQALTSLVADERYVQTLRRRRGGGQRRELMSEVVMVRGAAQSEWVMFRDVIKVDGRLIRDGKERLLELLRSPAPDALAAARRIAEESARFNIGRVTRTLNVPDTALSFLRPEHAPRIRYDSLRSESIDGVRHFVFRFQERHGPTIVRTPQGHDLPVEGRFWVTEQGAIRRTELMLRDRESIGSATVDFRDDAAVGLRVPVRMTETYVQAEELIEGSAEYSNFRRFSVKTSEKLTKPPGS